MTSNEELMEQIKKISKIQIALFTIITTDMGMETEKIKQLIKSALE